MRAAVLYTKPVPERAKDEDYGKILGFGGVFDDDTTARAAIVHEFHKGFHKDNKDMLGVIYILCEVE